MVNYISSRGLNKIKRKKINRSKLLAYLFVSTFYTLCIHSVLFADEWPAPQIIEVFSENRQYFVRVIPGNSIGDTNGFKGAARDKYAVAEFYQRQNDKSYEFTNKIILVNPVAPVEFHVSNSGHLVTLDNWHNLGYGKIVAFYNQGGKLIQSYELKDLFLDDEIASFSFSVSSIHWRKGPVYIRNDQRTFLVTVKSGADFLFEFETGFYKYCEYHEDKYRCRTRNKGRKWFHKTANSSEH